MCLSNTEPQEALARIYIAPCIINFEKDYFLVGTEGKLCLYSCLANKRDFTDLTDKSSTRSSVIFLLQVSKVS